MYLSCLLCGMVVHLFAQKETRVKEKFDFDWKFTLSDHAQYAEKDFIDAAWNDVQLPHDWSIRLDFDESISGSAAHLPGGIGWYRKTFQLPASYKGKIIAILLFPTSKIRDTTWMILMQIETLV